MSQIHHYRDFVSSSDTKRSSCPSLAGVPSTVDLNPTIPLYRQPAEGFSKGRLRDAGALSHLTHIRLAHFGAALERPIHPPPQMQRQKRAVGGEPSGGFRQGLPLAEQSAEDFAGGGIPIRPDSGSWK